MEATCGRPYQASFCLVSARRMRVQLTPAFSRAWSRRWVACPPRSTAMTTVGHSPAGSLRRRCQHREWWGR
eukprot:2271618-Lingulodinium_polyedra.AAC.1